MTHMLTTCKFHFSNTSFFVFLRFQERNFNLKNCKVLITPTTSIFEINGINKLTAQLCLEKEYNIVEILKILYHYINFLTMAYKLYKKVIQICFPLGRNAYFGELKIGENRNIMGQLFTCTRSQHL